jgi:hypothetical protein
VPSVPGYPPERQSAMRPAAGREIESFDNVESFTATLAAGTVFLPIANFSGTPDSIHAVAATGPVQIRIAFRGEAPPSFITLLAGVQLETRARGQFVEARDPAGAGGQVVIITGRYSSRAIDVRQNRPGPSRERPPLQLAQLGTQVPTTE